MYICTFDGTTGCVGLLRLTLGLLDLLQFGTNTIPHLKHFVGFWLHYFVHIIAIVLNTKINN